MITDAERERRIAEDRKQNDLYVFDVDRADLLGPLGWLPPFQGTRTEVVGNWHFRFYVRVLGLDLLEPVEVQHPETGEPVGEFRRAGLLPDPAAEGVAGDEVLILEVEDLPFRLPSDGGISGPPAADEEAPERAGEDGVGETIPEEEQVEEGAEEAVAAAPDVVVPPLLSEDEIAAMDDKQVTAWLLDIDTLVPGADIPEGILDLPPGEQREVCRRVVSDPETAKKFREGLARIEKRSSETRVNYNDFAIWKSNGQIGLDIARVGAYLREECHALTYRGTLYVYDRSSGLYCENEGHVESCVQKIAETIGFTGRITSAKKEVLSYVKDHRIEKEYPFNRYPGVPCKNGVLVIDYETGAKSLEPYSPEMRFKYRLPVTFDPGADAGPIDTVLRSWVEPEDVPLLYQIPAQALLHASALEKPFKKTYLLQGDGNAGKTTYLELLYAVFGAENCSGVALQRLGADRFAKGAMEDKVLNIYDDLSEVPLSNVGELKTLTGVFYHNIEKKGKDSYQGKIFCVFLFTCNAPPTFDKEVKNDSAFWSRWQYVVFPNCFPVDPTFTERQFTPENLSGFFNAVVDAAIQIRRQKRLLVDSDAYEVRDKWTCNSDPLYRFIQENLEQREKKYIRKDDFYEAVRKYWAYENVDPAKMPVSKDVLSKKLFAYGFTDERKWIDGKQERFYGGYDWKIGSRYRTEVESD